MTESSQGPIDPKTLRLAEEVLRQLRPFLPQFREASRLAQAYPITNRQVEEIHRLKKNLVAVQKIWPKASQIQAASSLTADLRRIKEERRRDIRILLGKGPPEGGEAETAAKETGSVMRKLERINRMLEKTLSENRTQRGRLEADKSGSSYVLRDVDLRFITSPKIRMLRQGRFKIVGLEQKGYVVLLRLCRGARQKRPVDGEDLLRLIKNPTQTREKARNLLGQIIRRIEESLARAAETLGDRVEAPGELIQSRSPIPSGRRSRKVMHRYWISIDPKRIVLPVSRSSNSRRQCPA